SGHVDERPFRISDSGLSIAICAVLFGGVEP
ncbi:MAG: hypothetical protein ACI93T_002834, partial [Porticoccaceae bacterium]